jgi:hypothetical protein
MAQSMKQPDLRNPYAYSWTQGAGHIVEALMGGYQSGQADRLERERQGAQADILSRPLGGPGEAAPLPPAAGGGLGARADAGDSSTSTPTAYTGGGNLDRYGAAISKLESGGKYDELGPVTRTGDRAYGKYQVMGANVPEWTEAATGKRMTPEEFRASPEAQEATFRHRFGSYLTKYGNPQDAASAWFTGGPQSTGANKRDQLGTTGQSYVSQFTNALGAQPALAFTGEATPATAPVPMPGGAPALPPAAQATVRALASAGSPGDAPAPQPPGPQFAQNAPPGGAAEVPPQVQVRQMAGALIRTGMDPATAIKTATEAVQAHQGFLPTFQRDDYGNIWSQVVGQPPRIVQQGPGKVVTYDPGVQGVPHQRYIENLARDPQTGAWRLTQTPFDPNVGGTAPAPITAPAAPRAPALPGTPGTTPVVPGAVPTPPNVLSSGTLPAAPAAGLPATAPATSSALQPAPPPGTPARPQPPPFTPRPGQSQDDWAREWTNYQQNVKEFEEFQKKQAQVQAERAPRTPEQMAGELDLEAAKGQIPVYQKKYDTITKMANEARDESLPQLQLLQRLMDAPGFYSGLLAPERANVDQVGKMLGISSGESADLLAFASKLGQSGSLANIRELVAQGAGAIRVPEMNMITKSNFDPVNPTPANKAVVELRIRTAQRMLEVENMAHNFMATGSIHPGAAARGPGRLTPEFDKLVADHFKNNPLIKPDEMGRFSEVFLGNKPAAPGALGTAPPPALPPTPANIAAAKAELARRQQQQQQAPGGPQQP